MINSLFFYWRFAQFINATTEEDLDKAGQHLANFVTTVGIDIVLGILTKRAAGKIKGASNLDEADNVDTGRVNEVNQSIRKRNPSDTSNQIYSVGDIGNEITKDPLASRAYNRITDQGLDVFLDKRPPEGIQSGTVGQFDHIKHEVRLYESNIFNTKDAASTIVHESTHVDYRLNRRIKYNSQYEEYRAFCREFLYNHKRRPNFEERIEIWETVKELYPDLRRGKQPLKNHE